MSKPIDYIASLIFKIYIFDSFFFGGGVSEPPSPLILLFLQIGPSNLYYRGSLNAESDGATFIKILLRLEGVSPFFRKITQIISSL